MSAPATLPVVATGPRTAEGKAASSQNATTHGLTSGRAVVAHEDRSAFDRLFAQYCEEFDPQTPHEEFVVRRMVDARWRLDRARNIENAAMDIMILGDASDDTPEHRIAQALLAKDGDALNRLQRYAESLERSYYRAHRELLQRRKEEAAVHAQHAQAEKKTAQAQFKAAEATLLEYLNAPLPSPSPRANREDRGAKNDERAAKNNARGALL